jgi:hypothetical protein
MKYLFVVCMSCTFVGAVRLPVETKVNITVSVVKKLRSSGIYFVHSGQEGKSRSAANTFQLAVNIPANAVKRLLYSWFYFMHSDQRGKSRSVTDICLLYITVVRFKQIKTGTHMLVNCWWSSPAQSILVPSPAGLTIIFYCLMTLRVIRHTFIRLYI